jgi:hypothetical protein
MELPSFFEAEIRILPLQILKDVHLNIFSLFAIAEIMLFQMGSQEQLILQIFLLQNLIIFLKKFLVI